VFGLKRLGLVKRPDPRLAGSSLAAMVERSGDLKEQLVTFAEERFQRALDRAVEADPELALLGDDGDFANVLDHFVLQQRLPDGRTVVDHFVDAHPELSEPERAMVLSWKDVVEGIFEVRRRDHSLEALNLVDGLSYRVHSNMDPGFFKATPPGSFFVGRLVPVGGEWLLSGAISVLPQSARADAIELAADLALERPELQFRNPGKLARAWELQRGQRRRFVAFFGSDVVVLPGREAARRMREYMRFQFDATRHDEGSPGGGDPKRHGLVSVPPDLALPPEITGAATVGVIYDEVDGLHFFPDFGLVEEAFARPEVGARGRHARVVRRYLESPGIAPLPLRRLAERDPENASRLFARLLRRPDFVWQRDGEALLRRHKARHFEQPTFPAIAVLDGEASRVVAARSRAAPALSSRQPRPNDFCPCGSGRKFKRCCGQ
jgi:hypothetical protein